MRAEPTGGPARPPQPPCRRVRRPVTPRGRRSRPLGACGALSRRRSRRARPLTKGRGQQGDAPSGLPAGRAAAPRRPSRTRPRPRPNGPLGPPEGCEEDRAAGPRLTRAAR
eukprot:gene15838-biopygen18741